MEFKDFLNEKLAKKGDTVKCKRYKHNKDYFEGEVLGIFNSGTGKKVEKYYDLKDTTNGKRFSMPVNNCEIVKDEN